MHIKKNIHKINNFIMGQNGGVKFKRINSKTIVVWNFNIKLDDSYVS